jgi:small GTP-binding protein
VFKILLAGAGGVGRTTLMTRAITGQFVADTSMTIGVDFHLCKLELGVENGLFEPSEITLQCYDLAGQDRWRFMQQAYVYGAKAAIITYDLTRMRTLDSIDEFTRLLRTYDPNLPILLVGMKLDRNNDIVVSDEYIEDFIRTYHFFDHIKVSAKDGTNVKDVFLRLVEEIARYNQLDISLSNSLEQIGISDSEYNRLESLPGCQIAQIEKKCKKSSNRIANHIRTRISGLLSQKNAEFYLNYLSQKRETIRNLQLKILHNIRLSNTDIADLMDIEGNYINVLEEFCMNCKTFTAYEVLSLLSRIDRVKIKNNIAILL